jgi:hypothetical protein
VTLSRAEWERLRDSRESLQKELERAEEKEAELLQQLLTQRAKTIRLRKQLRLAAVRTDTAVAQELDDLEAVEELETAFLPDEGTGVVAADRPFAFHDLLEMPPADWGSLDGVPLDSWEVPQSEVVL